MFLIRINGSIHVLMVTIPAEQSGKIVFAVAVDTKYPIQDQFYQTSIDYQNNIPHMKETLHFMIFSGVLFWVTVVWLTLGAGRKPQDEELHLLKFDSWKTEIAAAVVYFCLGDWKLFLFLWQESMEFTSYLMGLQGYVVRTVLWKVIHLFHHPMFRMYICRL